MLRKISLYCFFIITLFFCNACLLEHSPDYVKNVQCVLKSHQESGKSVIFWDKLDDVEYQIKNQVTVSA